MNVKQLTKLLQEETKQGYGYLEVRQFAHDHNPEIHDEGTGCTHSVYVYTNDKGETFMALCT